MRGVMFGGHVGKDKDNFLEKTRIERENRQKLRVQTVAAIKIQALFRGHRDRIHLKRRLREEVKTFLGIPDNKNDEYTVTLKNNVELFGIIKRLLYKFSQTEDAYYFECLVRYLLKSNDSMDAEISYFGIVTKNELVIPWINQIKDVAKYALHYLGQLDPNIPKDLRTISVYLSVLVIFTNPSRWKVINKNEVVVASLDHFVSSLFGHLMKMNLHKEMKALLMKGLVQTKPSLTQLTLVAVTNLCLRPVYLSSFSDHYLASLILHVLSVPSLIFRMNNMDNESFVTLINNRVCLRIIQYLKAEQHQKIIFNGLEGNYALCLLGNLIQLSLIEQQVLADHPVDFCMILSLMLERIGRYVEGKRSNLTHWHPVLGWFSQPVDKRLGEALPTVLLQLQVLWSPKMVNLLLTEVNHNPKLARAEQGATGVQTGAKRRLHSFKKSVTEDHSPMDISMTVKAASMLYCSAITTLSQIKNDILAGLSLGSLLPRCWRLISRFASAKDWADRLPRTPQWRQVPSEYHLLYLFSCSVANLIIILDDVELFEQQKVFDVRELVQMGTFFNEFAYRAISKTLNVTALLDGKFNSEPSLSIFRVCHKLLLVLYERDNRRQFMAENHWIVKDLRPAVFMSELRKGKPQAIFFLQTVPFIIAHKDRVILFRDYVKADNAALTNMPVYSEYSHQMSTQIIVHRSRMVEDGYRQLAALPTDKLKQVIRVRFVNDLGRDEIGIDQNGVFKEFLEEILKRVFDPSLNLFKVTSEQKLYPSPTSYLQENHLHLFEFVGRMLAKAIYEGIVVDVPFANFFLTQMLGREKDVTYSFIDELASLDPELYKHLTSFKHYEADVSQLELTFSLDEDVLGQLVTHDLVPGGRAVGVTNANKISYVHLVARFRMYTQIKNQSQAFIRGFKSIINPDWLKMFSGPELQKLISGDTVDIDIEDLKKNVQYFGGFHGRHRVIAWLWDILKSDFTAAERGSFLKFVTSCSKPPLLGFAHLEPQFSIRCVEVSEDQDTGDTLGSVIRGFFAMGRKDDVNRLPTASTCFNLLKLPNYSHKSTLRDKLRYAISSNSGFELS